MAVSQHKTGSSIFCNTYNSADTHYTQLVLRQGTELAQHRLFNCYRPLELRYRMGKQEINEFMHPFQQDLFRRSVGTNDEIYSHIRARSRVLGCGQRMQAIVIMCLICLAFVNIIDEVLKRIVLFLNGKLNWLQ